MDDDQREQNDDDGGGNNDQEKRDSRDTTLSYTTVDYRHYLDDNITSVRLPVGGPLAATRAPCSSLVP